jgi:hypothetical protein
MQTQFPTPVRAKALALAILCVLGTGRDGAAAAARGTQPAGTQTWIVQNCDDGGAGSLREAVEQLAGSGDTVDMTQLACGTIALQGGALALAQEELFLLGPGASSLAIDAGHASQVFVHTGQGALLLNGVTVRNGKAQSAAASVHGGCIASDGLVSLFQAVVTGCVAQVSGDNNAAGGGVYARGGLSIVRSTISGNAATATGPANLRGFGVGGGAFTLGRAEFAYTTIEGNVASGDGGGFKGQAGGAWVFGGGSLMRSTISGNTAGSVGGLLLIDATYGDPIDVESSTISGNVATDSDIGAGLYVGNTAQLTVRHSTITGNVERNASGTPYGAGLRLGYGDVPTRLVSSIVAGNHFDDGATMIASDVGGSALTPAITGEHNLIEAALMVVPADTLTQAPQLAALADNGGPTPTHALLPGSPAVDAGVADGVDHDQRGEGHPRVLGEGADIGAFESAPDAIFKDGFEGTCAGSCFLGRR